jgi:soluble lytic murein transglycosylase-like protein
MVTAPVLTSLEERVESWRVPLPAAELRGLRLLYDTPVPGGPTLAVVRAIGRSNHRLDPFDALVLATQAVATARARRLPYGFFCAVLLQESGFSPTALSSAGAVGIGQFTLETADRIGIDPFDWRDAMRGSAKLLRDYVDGYAALYPDPYAATLAAYNAGPGAVARYRGVPPYPETTAYVDDIYDRWARIVNDATGVRAAVRY